MATLYLPHDSVLWVRCLKEKDIGICCLVVCFKQGAFKKMKLLNVVCHMVVCFKQSGLKEKNLLHVICSLVVCFEQGAFERKKKRNCLIVFAVW